MRITRCFTFKEINRSKNEPNTNNYWIRLFFYFFLTAFRLLIYLCRVYILNLETHQINGMYNVQDLSLKNEDKVDLGKYNHLI